MKEISPEAPHADSMWFLWNYNWEWKRYGLRHLSAGSNRFQFNSNWGWKTFGLRHLIADSKRSQFNSNWGWKVLARGTSSHILIDFNSILIENEREPVEGSSSQAQPLHFASSPPTSKIPLWTSQKVLPKNTKKAKKTKKTKKHKLELWKRW